MPKRRQNPSPSSDAGAKRSKPDSSRESPLAISRERISACLERYPSLIPDKLADLDYKRFEEIPAAVAARSSTAASGAKAKAKEAGHTRKPKSERDIQSKGDNEGDDHDASGHPPGRHLTKKELVTLVEWKLKHGTFRPSLLNMAKAHPPELILSTTSEAFALLPDEPEAALKVLIKLRGIGPATASLLLSCADPAVPLFSDELFRWIMWDEPGPGGKGWERTIKYTEKEYKALAASVRTAVDERQGEVTAMDLEKIAYVLARE